MTDFITEALPSVNFENFAELESWLQTRAKNGDYKDLPLKLLAAGWTEEEAGRINVLVERFKTKSFRV